MKGKPVKPVKRESRTPAPSRPNPQVNRQNRKVLGQHYRAKYGVK